MHRPIARTLAAAAVVVALSVPARAGDPDEKARHADIRKLMVLTGAGQLGVQTMQEMVKALKPLVPQAPESFWQEFAAKINPDDLVEMVIPIYAKHLGAEDVKALIKFFESPAGRKLSSVQPAIMRESMAAGQAWGGRIAQELIRNAQARGFEIKQL
jgi:hypothetical protein